MVARLARLARLENYNIPRSIDHLSKKSIHDVSGLTAESTQLVVLSPSGTNHTTTRHRNEVIISQSPEEDKLRATKK